MKKYIFISLFINLLSCSTEDSVVKPDQVTPPTNQVPPTTITNKNRFDLKSITNLVLLNQAITSSTGKNASSNSTANFFVTDNSGGITNLKIPNSTSYTLNINSLMNCSENYILVSGDLRVDYIDGTKATYSNFILDKTDGAFYNLNPTAYALFQNVYSRIFRSTPWVGGEIQFDDNNCVYLKGESTGIIEEIYKAEFVKTSTESMDIKFTTINLIAEAYYFNYYVLKNGDILYMHKLGTSQMVWKVRFNSGKTVELNNFVYNAPFIVNGVKYFETIDPEDCFGIRSSNGEFILFVKGNENKISMDPGIPNESSVMIKPFKLTTDGNSLNLEAILAKINAAENHLNVNFELFTDYYHGMWNFNSDNFHVFTSRGYTNENATIWWSFDDKENVFKTAFAPYSGGEFSTYSKLLGYSNKFACVPIKKDVHFINLETLTVQTINNLDFQIFKTTYRNDDVLQFYGISYNSGKKVYGEISQAGSVKILNEFENTVEVKEIFKIGNF